MRPETVSAMARMILLVFAALAWMGAPAVAQCGPLPGDSNDNLYVELLDHSDLVKCLAGPAETPQPEPPQSPETCLADFDADSDFDTDLLDFAEFQVSFTGRYRSACFNIIFVSSASFQPNLGSVQAYDNQCNILATAAGLNNPAGNAFVAWVSATNSNAVNRFGIIAPRGFVRPDGVPVTDKLSDLFTNSIIWNPIRVDELGNDVGANVVMTGTNADGSSSTSTCTNWTVTTGSLSLLAGSTAGGPLLWTQNTSGCNQGPFRIYCFQKTISRALSPVKWPGKVIYLTNTLFTPGGGLAAADQLCASEKPAGVGAVRALLATSSSSAASRLIPSTQYVRVDGQIVGTATELSTANFLQSGIWQSGNGSYLPVQPVQFAWTGSPGFSAVGTVNSTCNNWTSTTSISGTTGLPSTTQAPVWWSFTSRNCTTPLRLYCAEQ